ncbi:o-succinylbenzoate synthase [Ferrimonas balearica]|uniref:o-succinylbenzoate synthase n=1 Tax=Ferrimonas balearica TaxID=44012 RepID=UPI001C5B1C67|nr:o-succinylbenzoate synthase [Ferrimonas balearica]MBW3166187.1 o-succinylbenzoate synthase [Ferrimonas balearica]
MKLYPYALPLATPLRFAGQSLDQRHGLLIKLERDGHTGWGDCAPLPGFSHESLAQCQSALQALAAGQIDEAALPPAAHFALDCARWQCEGPHRLTLPASIPLLVGTPEQQLAQFDALTTPPGEVKLKLARAPMEQEIALVYALLERQPKLLLRIDANRGWSAEQASHFAASVPPAALRYVEEPCANLNDSLRVAAQHRLPLALDETTQVADYQYESLPGVRALVLKPTLIGSLARLQQLVQQARLDGVEVVLSSSFESNIGLTHLAHLAAELTPDSVPGLDTLAPLGADLLEANPWGLAKPVITESELTPL